jgi:hypothetical protein
MDSRSKPRTAYEDSLLEAIVLEASLLEDKPLRGYAFSRAASLEATLEASLLEAGLLEVADYRV